MTLALAIATFLAAVGLTYWCCVRPMRRDRSRHAMAPDASTDTAAAERRRYWDLAEGAWVVAEHSAPPGSGIHGAEQLDEGRAIMNRPAEPAESG